MSKFKVGEIAILIKNYFGSNNIEVEIIDLPVFHDYEIEVPGLLAPDGTAWTCSESSLRKLPSKDEPTTWESCIWRPRGIKA